MKMLHYSDPMSRFDSVVNADYIVKMDKSIDGELTYIYLKTGDVLYTDDSLKTLVARMESL